MAADGKWPTKNSYKLHSIFFIKKKEPHLLKIDWLPNRGDQNLHILRCTFKLFWHLWRTYYSKMHVITIQ